MGLLDHMVVLLLVLNRPGFYHISYIIYLFLREKTQVSESQNIS